ncbi:MAG: hypothetical protein JW384_00744 [Nitrosomonadaceae bacterium]|nr:hypothetical protein [Nitrosomonadaceae bacterium]
MSESRFLLACLAMFGCRVDADFGGDHAMVCVEALGVDNNCTHRTHFSEKHSSFVNAGHDVVDATVEDLACGRILRRH